MIAAKFITLQTAATGTNYTAFADVACHTVNVLNNTGQSLTFQHVADTDNGTFVLEDGQAWAFRGLNNAKQLRVKRTDDSNSQVTLNSVEVEL